MDERLQYAFDYANEYVKGEDTIFVWVSSTSIDGVTFGRYRHVKKQDLFDRRYTVHGTKYEPIIHFDDTLYVIGMSEGPALTKRDRIIRIGKKGTEKFIVVFGECSNMNQHTAKAG